MQRRHFIHLVIMGTWGTLGGAGRVLGQNRGNAGEMRLRIQEAPTVERIFQALGTTIRLQVRHETEVRAAAAIDDALAEVEQIESIFSLFRPLSSIVQLNQHGILAKPDPRLVSVLQIARQLGTMSAGAFDVTVQPLWELYEPMRRRDVAPHPREVEETLKYVGWHHVHLDSQHLKLNEGTRITCNGIAQGYAADRVRDVLLRHQVLGGLVDLGELGSVGNSATDRPWRVGIQHPRRADSFLGMIELDGRFLATSGDYATRFTDDFRCHAIVDPSRGESPQYWSSVSVLAPTGTWADALSTTLMNMPLASGLTLLRRFAQVDALFVRKDGRIQATAGFPQISFT